MNTQESSKRRYIFITGGVISSLGKGTIASSTGRILKDYGFRVTNVKCEMYVNIDSGTIRPTEHGEVFVTNDGLEADQDLGNYERFTGNDMGRVNFMTYGQIYQTIIEKERNFEYEGEDVEVVPHVPQEIIRRIQAAGDAADADVVISEFGGTVGEYQVTLFLEAARMMERLYPDQVAHIHVSYLPIPPSIGEMKTKPAQYSIRTLNAAGIQPDIVIGRAEQPMDDTRKEKLAWISGVAKEDIISSPDCSSIYRVPTILEEQNYAERLCQKLGLELPQTTNPHAEWTAMTDRLEAAEASHDELKIGIVGKYFETGEFTLEDSYVSVLEAIKHAAWAHNKKPVIQWLSSEAYEKDAEAVQELSTCDGIIVPGGYGARGTEGKIRAIQYVREHKIPFLGLCLGLQMATIEFARNVVGLTDATTTEIDPGATTPVIHALEETKEVLSGEKGFGGTQRVGAYACTLKEGSVAQKAYGTADISERHRHRYEVNNAYREQLESSGLVVSGVNPDLDLVEVIELPDHPFFVASQFHPEFLSRPLDPHPLFLAFIKAAI